ncbi:speckle-type POZ protein-like [Schistocerca gregaria]|uniref:speckle-type POZ protein-like n=1 Tax=Schistocerca gregaria TaxID=7010 RepID=UPI00211E4A0E|nr:speckle-type POZ protein-like [Schistocerca gregaria]XP_049853876.1 speckle-type POZ protein-like [Schistocerca gregaria]XP_049853877.1 speckle-type POZ protein-like [Schistocerca gregaria]XP_049853878.1 speckle-type POZ protein-like [Schistocerca gregaria]
MQQPHGSPPNDLRSLLESGLGADVSVVAADGQLPAHSSVLVAQSSVFDVLLRRGKELILIPDMPVDVVQQLLTFLYTDEVPQLQSVAPQLLVLADRFELHVLKEMCEQYLVEDLRVENTVPYCVLALRYSCPHLRKAAIEYFARHALPVLGSQGWVQELRKDPRPLMEISRLVASHAITEASVEELGKLLASGIRMDEEKIST